MANYPNNTLILTQHPYVGFMPEDLRLWIAEHSSDSDLATALSAVHNHIGRLGHELGECDDYWLIYAYDAWCAVETDLYELIILSMRISNRKGETSYNLQHNGLYWLVKPFMEKYGFRDGYGWWIQADPDQ